MPKIDRTLAPQPAPETAKRWREVGFVGGVHGLRGEMVLRCHHDGSDSIASAKRVRLVSPSGSEGEFAVAGRRPTTKGTIVQLEGLASREAAGAWKSATVWVHQKDLGPLGEGEFYLEDIRGFDAMDHCGGAMGRVTGFVWTNIDIAVIRSSAGHEWLFPLLPDRVLGVDYDARVVRLDTDGLEELWEQ